MDLCNTSPWYTHKACHHELMVQNLILSREVNSWVHYCTSKVHDWCGKEHIVSHRYQIFWNDYYHSSEYTFSTWGSSHACVSCSSWISLEFCTEPLPLISSIPPASDIFVILCNSSVTSEVWDANWWLVDCSVGPDGFGLRMASAASGITTGGGWGGTHVRCTGGSLVRTL